MTRISERSEQAAIADLCRALGAAVYTLGTVRRRADAHHGTMQSAGLPDLLVFLPRRDPTLPFGSRELIAVEVKARGGRLSDAQREFGRLCGHARVPYLVGGLDDLIAWLQDRRYLRKGA